MIRTEQRRVDRTGIGQSSALRPRLANLHGQVSEMLATRILGGTYAPGEVLPVEADLCEALGVSRTTLREAVKNLAAKGLIEVAPSRGTRVRPVRDWNLLDAEMLRWRMLIGVDRQLVQDIYEMRECFEPKASALAAGRGTENEHARIDAAFQDMKASRTEASERATEADVSFHTAILIASRNPFLAAFATMIEGALRVSFLIARKRLPLSEADLEQHEAILRAILKRDAPQAHRATEALLAASKAVQIEAAAEMDPDEPGWQNSGFPAGS